MLIERPAAVVEGPSAALLSLLLRSPSVQQVLRVLPLWARAHRGEIAAAVDAIHRAAAAWTVSGSAFEREDATAASAARAESGACTVMDAAVRLGLSVRRTQELARDGALGGRRVGRVWVLDVAAVDLAARARRSA